MKNDSINVELLEGFEETALDPNRLPKAPGVYLMYNSRDEVIYVGKAVNLRARVRSYFSKSGDNRFTVKYLVGALTRIETIVTSNEKEAFLLENTLIKKHRPRYNIQLRDDKTYVSVKIDMTRPWPWARLVRPRGEKARSDKALYFGPYASSKSVRQTLKLLQKVFPIRSCTDSVFANRSRPCLLHQIGRCVAPCVLPVVPEEYAELVRGTVLSLQGKNDEAVRILESRMREHSEAMEYEKAAVMRDRIQAIDETIRPQRVTERASYNRDVIGYTEEQGVAAVIVLQYRRGTLTDSRHYLLKAYEKPSDVMLYGFLSRYYDQVEFTPDEIFLNLEPADSGLLEEWLGEMAGRKVRLRRPVRGEKVGLAAMAEDNAREILRKHLSGEKQIEQTL
ncbi:MAG: excinuclease ABC subunit C, partial [Proteobacteria bacterium]|nr:excinuclease ABC subunit C [Pseudomonadota bacterium]